MMPESHGRIPVDRRVVPWTGIFQRIGNHMRCCIGNAIELRRVCWT